MGCDAENDWNNKVDVKVGVMKNFPSRFHTWQFWCQSKCQNVQWKRRWEKKRLEYSEMRMDVRMEVDGDQTDSKEPNQFWLPFSVFWRSYRWNIWSITCLIIVQAVEGSSKLGSLMCWRDCDSSGAWILVIPLIVQAIGVACRVKSSLLHGKISHAYGDFNSPIFYIPFVSAASWRILDFSYALFFSPSLFPLRIGWRSMWWYRTDIASGNWNY